MTPVAVLRTLLWIDRSPRLNVPLLLVLVGLVELVGPVGGAAGAQGAPPSKDAFRMGSPASLPPGSTVETMWPPPAAEDWQRPVLVPFQRSFDDALRIAGETGQPILVCVNMDGEPASEHYAGIRYRSPETAAALAPYVCVAASVYRHTPRDHDGQGRRVLCPRLGSVTCGEHIALETELYAKFFEGQRIAPRHIMLEADGAKVYDVYYSWDTATVYTAFRKGVEGRAPPRPRGELPLVERGASPDVLDRTAVEEAYLSGSREVRRALLEASLRVRELDQVDLLRLALFGLDVELARLARAALAGCETEAAVDLIAEALKRPMDEAERAALLAAAERLAEKYPRARTLVAVQRGLAAPSRWVDAEGWAEALQADYRAGAEHAPLGGARIDERAAAAEERPADAEARLAFAEALLARAQDPSGERRFATLLLEDARAGALEAERLGARGWRLDAVLAVASAARGDDDAAVTRALAAIEGGMPRPGTASAAVAEPTAVAVLALFARARQRAIADAYRAREPWPPEWLADVHAAYAVLVRHPLGTDRNVADCHDFLAWLGASARAAEALEQGLARFPESWILHERLRARILREQSPEDLEAAYAALLARDDAAPALGWFAGLAALVAAENHRRAGATDKALAAYERGLALYERDVARHPEHRESADHYVALARAGRAKLALERGELERATAEILAAIAQSPTAAAAFDGLGIAPLDTARMLLARLEQDGRADLAEQLQAGLDALDPRLLDLPDLQRGVPNEGARAGDRRGRRSRTERR